MTMWGEIIVQPIMSFEEVEAFLEREFPQMHARGSAFVLEAIGPGTATMRLDASEQHLRPGGTVSGPSLFALADLAAYAVILAHVGPVALAVTTNMSINFLRRPAPGPILGKACLLKLGKRLVVTEIGLHSPAEEEPVAHAVGTYSVPPQTSRASG